MRFLRILFPRQVRLELGTESDVRNNCLLLICLKEFACKGVTRRLLKKYTKERKREMAKKTPVNSLFKKRLGKAYFLLWLSYIGLQFFMIYRYNHRVYYMRSFRVESYLPDALIFASFVLFYGKRKIPAAILSLSSVAIIVMSDISTINMSGIAIIGTRFATPVILAIGAIMSENKKNAYNILLLGMLISICAALFTGMQTLSIGLRIYYFSGFIPIAKYAAFICGFLFLMEEEKAEKVKADPIRKQNAGMGAAPKPVPPSSLSNRQMPSETHPTSVMPIAPFNTQPAQVVPITPARMQPAPALSPKKEAEKVVSVPKNNENPNDSMKVVCFNDWDKAGITISEEGVTFTRSGGNVFLPYEQIGKIGSAYGNLVICDLNGKEHSYSPRGKETRALSRIIDFAKESREAKLRMRKDSMRCNGCGHIFCYTPGDILRNKNHGSAVKRKAYDNVKQIMAAYQPGDPQNPDASFRNMEQTLGYAPCPNCKCEDIVPYED